MIDEWSRRILLDGLRQHIADRLAEQGLPPLNAEQIAADRVERVRQAQEKLRLPIGYIPTT